MDRDQALGEIMKKEKYDVIGFKFNKISDLDKILKKRTKTKHYGNGINIPIIFGDLYLDFRNNINIEKLTRSPAHKSDRIFLIKQH